MHENHLHCYLNDELLPLHEATVSIQNRSFRYGDGIFESIRVVHKNIPFFHLHYQRLIAGLNALQIEIPNHFNKFYIKSKLIDLIAANKIESDARIRLTLYRQGEGNYTPENNRLGYLMECTPLASEGYSLNKQGLMLDIFYQYQKDERFLTHVKHASALIYVLASRFAKDNNCAEAIIINNSGRVVESSSSNIFIIKDNKIITPPLSEGALPGVMRSIVLTIGTWHEMAFVEQILTIDDVLNADEVFLTNAIKGIQWVVGCQHKRYFRKQTPRLVDALNMYCESLLF